MELLRSCCWIWISNSKDAASVRLCLSWAGQQPSWGCGVGDHTKRVPWVAVPAGVTLSQLGMSEWRAGKRRGAPVGGRLINFPCF